MATVIDEIIRVGAVFGGTRKLKPVWFIWKEYQYRVKTVTYCWVSKQGAAAVYHFSVSDQADNLYELQYNTKSMVWILYQAEYGG